MKFIGLEWFIFEIAQRTYRFIIVNSVVVKLSIASFRAWCVTGRCVTKPGVY